MNILNIGVEFDSTPYKSKEDFNQELNEFLKRIKFLTEKYDFFKLNAKINRQFSFVDSEGLFLITELETFIKERVEKGRKDNINLVLNSDDSIVLKIMYKGNSNYYVIEPITTKDYYLTKLEKIFDKNKLKIKELLFKFIRNNETPLDENKLEYFLKNYILNEIKLITD